MNEEEKVRGVAARELLQAQKQNEINIAQKKSEQQQQAINNEMRLEAAKTEAAIVRENAKANAEAIKEEALANEKLLTDQYLQLKRYEAMLANSKMIFGDIPNNVFLNGNEANAMCVKQ